MPAVSPPNKAMRATQTPAKLNNRIFKIRFIYGSILVVFTIFIIRLFYLQVIKYDYYHQKALSSQLKEYEIPAERGAIYAHDGSEIVPLVLNEKKYTVFADPIYIKDPEREALELVKIIGGDANQISDLLKNKDTRYAVLAKKISKEQADKVEGLGYAGIGTREQEVRTYPEGSLASQTLGFVNDEGRGQYGIEGFLDELLSGKAGRLKAITDAKGVPLVTNKDNVVIDPESGSDVTITIDMNVQKQLERILKDGLDRAESESGSALIMDVNTGAIIAMASYPSFDPTKIADVTDLSTLSNTNVSSQIEVGSIMKTLAAAAAINQGAITKDTTYFDPAKETIDGATLSNVSIDGGPAVRSVQDILRLSLNTGAIWMLKQIGGGQLNEKGREIWHDYMVDHFGFGKATGVEQTGETDGYVPSPTEGDALNLTYAKTTFGQAMSATMLQIAAAYSSVLNGGSYHKPYLVESSRNDKGEVSRTQTNTVRTTITQATSQDVIGLLKGVFDNNHVLYGLRQLPESFTIGGKTGSAEIAKPEGGYYDDKFTGTFAGFVGGDKPQYVIVDRVDAPKIWGYAGSASAAPIFSDLVTMLINNYNVTPKTK